MMGRSERIGKKQLLSGGVCQR